MVVGPASRLGEGLAFTLLSLFLGITVCGLGAERVVHEGDLVVGVGETLVIENVTYEQRGDIRVEATGHLAVRNATLEIPQGYCDQYGIRVKDQGVLELQRSTVSAPPSGVRVDSYGTSRVLVSGTNGGWHLTLWVWEDSELVVSDSEIGTVDLGDRAAVSLSASVVDGFIRLNLSQGCAMTVADLRKGHLDAWSTRTDASGSVPFSLTIADCDIGGWGVIVCEPASVEVLDSELEGIEIGLHDTAGWIRDLSQAAHYVSWQLARSDFTGPTPAVRLLNVSILSAFGLMLGDNCSVRIDDSNVALTLVGRNLDVALSASTCTWLGSHSSSGRFRFTDCVVRNYVKFYDSSLHWSGSVAIARDIEVGAWVNSTVRRVYDLQVSDRAGRAVVGAELTLRSPSAGRRVLSTDKTDQKGHAELTVPFTAEDWQREFPVLDASGRALATLRFLGPASLELQVR